MKISFFTADKIDEKLWNECINKHKAPIYNQYVYLTYMSITWSAFIFNDYEAVLPICYKKKLGIIYSFIPAFVQQMGVIGTISLTPEELFNLIKKHFKYGDVFFNTNNAFMKLYCRQRTNYIINLKSNYENLISDYKNELKKDLKVAYKNNLHYTIFDDVGTSIKQYEIHYNQRMNINAKLYIQFTSLCEALQKIDCCFIRVVKNREGLILSYAVFLKDENRIYNIANTTTTEGKQKHSNHFLFDQVLKEFANTNLIFDFEGSNIEGIANFYKKFGAVNETYFHWHFNELPFYIKWFKK